MLVANKFYIQISKTHFVRAILQAEQVKARSA